MTGLPKFSKVPTRNFERWLKRLIKYYKGSREKQAFIAFVFQLVDELCDEPRPSNSALEPIPGKMTLEELEFRKLRFTMPGLRGASGQGRLMYLIDSTESKIILVWIYTHKEFEGRPDDKSLKISLHDAIASLTEEADSPINSEAPRNPLDSDDSPDSI
jgi:hypothetical protein